MGISLSLSLSLSLALSLSLSQGSAGPIMPFSLQEVGVGGALGFSEGYRGQAGADTD